MSQDKRELLSAFMDGELEGDAAPVIDELLRDESMRLKWMRYHLIADTMRHSLPEHLDRQFSAGVAARLSTEPTVLSPARRKYPAYLKPVAGLAVAASVAAMAIIGIQYQGQQGGNGQPAMATVASAPEQAAPAAVTASDRMADLRPIQPNIPAMRQYTFPVRKVSAGGTTAVPRSEVNSRLRNYLLNYNDYHAHAGMQGMLPYVRIVAHDNE